MNTVDNNLLSSIKDPAIAKQILNRIRSAKINVLLIGATGVGKSSTISALFENYGNGQKSQVKVGRTAEPETIDISSHELGSLNIWDTPGLGDSTEKDAQHQRLIVKKLQETDPDGKPLIDLVFLILHAGSKDFGSAYRLFKDVVLPNLDSQDRKRLLIGINQSDRALNSDRYWNAEENKPEPKLTERLEHLVKTVQNRIKDETGLDIEPIYYVAGFEDEGEIRKPYNLQKLMSFILERLPEKKRAAIATHINQNSGNFESNDDKENYKDIVEKSIFSSVIGYAKEFAEGTMKMAKDILSNEEVKKQLTSIGLFIIQAILKKKTDAISQQNDSPEENNTSIAK